MKSIKCIAFDCFGTVFNMAGIPQKEISDYVRHVKANDFSPYRFPTSWYNRKLHPDARDGIKSLQQAGYHCAALSNGSADLLWLVSRAGGVEWDTVVDLVKHRVYKPHVDAYRTVEKETGFLPGETLMVTANPTFGDVEGAAAIGMPSQVIRHGYPNTIIELAEMLGVGGLAPDRC